MAVIAVVAVAERLVPVLRGGGLFGSSGYDGAVYYGASVGLAHGLLPYRDFLLLHPPGITLALLPFALVGRLAGDAAGMAVGGVAFPLLGGLNAVLVSRLLRQRGGAAAAAGGLFYAVFFPAVFMERGISLEALATLCLLGALLLLTRPGAGAGPGAWAVLSAGALLGVGAGVKIWGVVVALAVLAWCARVLGVRSAARATAGMALGAGLVCGPFFLAAPGPMWRMVVLDQLGRPRSHASLPTRVADVLGLSRRAGFPPQVPHAALLVAALVLAAVCAGLALRSAVGRLAVLLAVSCGALLLLTPSWFVHYAGLTAAPGALVVGAATASGLGHLRRRPAQVLVAVLAVLVLTASTAQGLTRTFGTPFPGRQVAAAAATARGCVTADEPTTLIESDLLARNLARGCPLVVDLGGYSYDLPTRDRSAPRSHDPVWQRHAVRYLASGSVAIITRFRKAHGFSRVTASTVRHWPVVGRAGRYLLRHPGRGTPNAS